MDQFNPLSNDDKLKLCKPIGLTPLNSKNDVDCIKSCPLGISFNTHKIQGDGNCLFRAISYSVCGSEDYHGYFRSLIVSYISSTKNGKKIVAHEQDIYRRTSKMDENGVWGTDIEILGASSLFGMNIFVFTKYGLKEDWLAFRPIDGKLKVQGAIYLHHKDGNHYDVAISTLTNQHGSHSENAEQDTECDSLSVDDQYEFSLGESNLPSSTSTTLKASFGISSNLLEDTAYDSVSVDDQYDFSLGEFSSPISTSTPLKISKNKSGNESEVLPQMDHLNVSNVSVFNTSFEEAFTIFKPTNSTRTRRPVLQTKAVKTASEVLLSKCHMKCLRHVKTKDVERMREKFWGKPYENRIEWFLDKLYEGCQDIQKKASFIIEGGNVVCGSCFRKLYRINKNFFYKFINKAKQGVQSCSIATGRLKSDRRIMAGVWLDMYAYYHADKMPDTGYLLLPYRTRKIDLYHLYSKEMMDKLHSPVSKSLFFDIWKEKKSLKIKQTNSFSKCNTCVHLERELEKTRDIASRTSLKSMVAVHNERQMNERRYYYEKREQARNNPTRYLSLIIDGMDQAKTNLPHFTGRLLKGVDPNSFLRTHIQGIINHGCRVFKCYVDINEYSHDSNLVLNILMKSIYDTQTKIGTLPDVLYIQADNCARENKNKYVLSFCELLVRCNLFREVHLSFLPVGHTHEDIDAKFSNLADILRRNDAETLPALLQVIPNASQTRGLFDIRAWLSPCINVITNHSRPLHFKFLSVGDQICMFYKSSCGKDWTLSDNLLLQHTPKGVPNILLPPNMNKIIIPSLKENIFRHKYNLEERQFWWWQRFLDEIERMQSDKQSMENYAEHHAKWLLSNLKTIPEREKKCPEKRGVPKPHLVEMVDKELDDHKVKVLTKGPKRKR